MSISAASSSVLLSCAQRIGLSNQPGSAANCAEALNAELAAAATAPCRTFRLVTITDRFYDFSGKVAQCVQSPYVALTASAGGDALRRDVGCGHRERKSDRSGDRPRRRALGGDPRRKYQSHIGLSA